MVDDEPQQWVEMVTFSCGPYACLMDARRVQAMAATATQAVAVESWLGLTPPAPGAARRFLRIGPDALSLSVAEPVQLTRIPLNSLHPLPAIIEAACSLPALRALQYRDNALSLVLEPPQAGRASESA